MVYRWNKEVDVDEAVVVLMNVLDENDSVPEWLRRTMQQAIYDSDAKYTRYFFDEVKKHVPSGLKFFEESGGAD